MIFRSYRLPKTFEETGLERTTENAVEGVLWPLRMRLGARVADSGKV
ncbi:MAG TPA: hypothetical protein VG407_18785 [Caulobacteraceae bacterium]|nr:hypothetical protein [Caulobacteraceae bacterium]